MNFYSKKVHTKVRLNVISVCRKLKEIKMIHLAQLYCIHRLSCVCLNQSYWKEISGRWAKLNLCCMTRLNWAKPKNSYFELNEQWVKEEEVLKNALISKVLTNRLIFIGKVTLKENFNMLIVFFLTAFHM